MKKKENLENKSVLDDGFLGELKKVDVPDSDDECYFWFLLKRYLKLNYINISDLIYKIYFI